MEKDTVEKIKNKSFFELSQEERRDMKELFTNEEEFNEIKAMFIQMDKLTVDSFKPSKNVKEELDHIFVQQYAATQSKSFLALIVPKNKPFYRQPLVQLAAMALLILLVVPVFNSPLVEETIQVAKIEEKENIENIEKDNLNNVKSDSLEQFKKSAELELDEEVSKIHSDQLTEERTEKMQVLQPQILPGPDESTPAASVKAEQAIEFNHPDGIYQEDNEHIAFTSVSVEESNDLLDLLTTTF